MCLSGQLPLSNTNSHVLAYSLGMGRKRKKKKEKANHLSLNIHMYLYLGTFSWVIANWLMISILMRFAVLELSGRQRTGVGAESLGTECLAGIHMGCRYPSGARAPKARFAHSSSSHATGVWQSRCRYPNLQCRFLAKEVRSLPPRWGRGLKQAVRSIWCSPLATRVAEKLKRRRLRWRRLGEMNPSLP